MPIWREVRSQPRRRGAIKGRWELQETSQIYRVSDGSHTRQVGVTGDRWVQCEASGSHGRWKGDIGDRRKALLKDTGHKGPRPAEEKHGACF